MSALSRVSELRDLRVSLYSRPLHPELLAPLAEASVDWSGGRAQLLILPTGHATTVTAAGCTLTEVLTEDAVDGLPQGGRLLRKSLKRAGDLTTEAGPLMYATSCHEEHVDAEIFERIDREVTLDVRDATLSARIGGGGRLSPSAVSVITATPVDGGVSVHTVHTFPKASAVVRTQSLFELAAANW